MKKLFSLTFFTMLLSFASFATPGPITGNDYLCLGSIGYLDDSLSPGGSWSSSNTAVATIGLSTGYVYGVSAGTTTITYAQGGSIAVLSYTVYAAPPASITGTTSFCVGTTAQLSDATPGGTWSTSAPTIATIASTGSMYGWAAGTAYITYTTGSGLCQSTSIAVTVGSTNTGFVTGPSSVCTGSTVTLMDSTTGILTGTWSSGSTTVATIDPSTGVVYGVSVGTTTISYAVNGTCGLAYATHTVHVVSTVSAGTISGTSTVNIGSTVSLGESVSGGVWSCSNTAVATIDASGTVTGIAAGSATITYTVAGCGGSSFATYPITVTPINGISGNVNFTGTAYYGLVHVWLITYNGTTQDLEAIDSAWLYCTSGTSVHYQFLGIATDSYRVKAAVYDSFAITTGYVPTYHTSSFYWYTANVINHTSGTADANEDINMAYGTITSGPGFIGGNVTAGANKGTIVTVPSVGLHMNIFNSSNQLLQSVQTDASGNYSFSNLPLGTYYVFPDSLNYMTTAYTGITLTSGASSMTTAGFTQHTVSKVITPNTESVGNISNTASTVFAFPNPANNKLNLQWQESTTEKGTVTLTDITGRDIYSTVINMTEGTGIKQIDLSGFANGLYIISVKSGTINYNSKIQIQK